MENRNRGGLVRLFSFIFFCIAGVLCIQPAPVRAESPVPDFMFFPLQEEPFFETDAAFLWEAARSPRKKDTVLFQASPGTDPKLLTFKQRNSGAFKRKKKGGLKDPGMAVLCSSLVPGLGQIYNGQWWKTPVIYAGGAVAGYFMDFMLRNRRIYDKELKAILDDNGAARNPDLAGYSQKQILDLRNYYEQYFELTIILTGVWYLLNIMDAAVYAHLSSFNVSSDLSMSIQPYAATVPYPCANPLDAGIRVCFKF